MYFSETTTEGTTTVECLVSGKTWSYNTPHGKREQREAAVSYQKSLFTKQDLREILARDFYSIEQLEAAYPPRN